MANETADRFRVLLSCPDRRGIVAEVSRLLAEQGANVTAAAQFTDPASHQFFVRYEVETDSGSVTSTSLQAAWPWCRFVIVVRRWQDPAHGQHVAQVAQLC